MQGRRGLRFAVLMGVSGCGKSTLGRALSARTGVPYLDGDDLHPPGNIEKMSRGIPLTDADRRPWLTMIADTMRSRPGPVMVGCSALKRAYRDLIRERLREDVLFLHLHAERAVLERRVAARPGHFMPADLLQSQLETLEPLEADETGAVIDVARPLDDTVAAALAQVRANLRLG